MKTIRLASAALAALALIASGVRAVGAADPVTIRVGATANDTAAEVYYADELGFFKKRGLDVQIQNLSNGAAEAAAVAGGALDIGEQNIISMAHAHERGLNFMYLFPAGEFVNKESTTSLIVPTASTVKTGKDLEGKTLAVFALGDLAQIGAAAWIDKNGGDSTKVKFIEMPSSQVGAAVARGTIDGGVIAEPALRRAQDTGNVRVLAQPYSALGDRFMINGWFAKSDWIAKNPDAAKKFADAIAEAAIWANTHHQESAEILAKHSKVSLAVLSRMQRSTYGEKFDTKAMQSVIDSAVRYKGLAKPFAASEIVYAH